MTRCEERSATFPRSELRLAVLQPTRLLFFNIVKSVLSVVDTSKYGDVVAYRHADMYVVKVKVNVTQ